jgi:hypothetical protein
MGQNQSFSYEGLKIIINDAIRPHHIEINPVTNQLTYSREYIGPLMNLSLDDLNKLANLVGFSQVGLLRFTYIDARRWLLFEMDALDFEIYDDDNSVTRKVVVERISYPVPSLMIKDKTSLYAINEIYSDENQNLININNDIKKVLKVKDITQLQRVKEFLNTHKIAVREIQNGVFKFSTIAGERKSIRKLK